MYASITAAIAFSANNTAPNTAQQKCTNQILTEHSVCENRFLKNCLPSAKKSKLPSHQVFGVFALEINKIMQATPSKLRREMGMCATTLRTAAAVVLYDTSTRCTYSSLEPLVPGAAYLVPGTVHASTQQTIQIRGTGVCRA